MMGSASYVHHDRDARELFASTYHSANIVKGDSVSRPAHMPPDIRLVIAVIDGTLVAKEKLLTPHSIRAAEMLQEAGIIFGATTGLPPKGVRMLVEPLPRLRFIARFNGAVIVSRDFSVFAENLLSVHVAKQISKILLEYNLDVWLYTDRDWFIHDPQAYRVAREQATALCSGTVA